MMDRYGKLERIIPNPNTNAKTVARIISVHLMANLSTPLNLLTHNGLQFVPKSFVAVRSTLGLKIIITTKNHRQKWLSGAIQLYKCAAILLLCAGAKKRVGHLLFASDAQIQRTSAQSSKRVLIQTEAYASASRTKKHCTQAPLFPIRR